MRSERVEYRESEKLDDDSLKSSVSGCDSAECHLAE